MWLEYVSFSYWKSRTSAALPSNAPAVGCAVERVDLRVTVTAWLATTGMVTPVAPSALLTVSRDVILESERTGIVDVGLAGLAIARTFTVALPVH